MRHGLRNNRASVCLFVCYTIPPQHAAAAGLLLGARGQAMSIDCCTACLPHARPAATAPQHAARRTAANASSVTVTAAVRI